MKNLLIKCVFTLFGCILMGAGTANHLAPKYSSQQIIAFIREVYADQAELLVFDHDVRFRRIENFLSRINIIQRAASSEKKFALLSDLSLIDKYNAALSRDVKFDPITFNPLKYNFPMASTERKIYRVDHTYFLIVIDPIR